MLACELVGPGSFGPKLFREVVHLVGQNPVFGQEVPLERVRPERHRQQRHVGLFGGFVVFLPIAAFAGGHHVFPAVGSAARQWVNMVAGEFRAGQLVATVEATMVVAPKQGTVT